MSLYTDPLAQVVESINRLNKLDLVASQYIFGVPVADSSHGPFANTKISISAKDTQSAYAGSQDVWYRRLDLASLAVQANLDLPIHGHTTTLDVVNALNRRFGTALTSADIANRALTATEMQLPGTITLDATTTSLGWIGSVTVNTRLGGYRLQDTVTQVSLPGLNYPSPTTTRPYAYIYSYSQDYSASYDDLVQVLVGQDQLQQVLNALKAHAPADPWVLVGSSRYSLQGAAVQEVGDTADHPDKYNVNYDKFVRVLLDDQYCVGLTGELILHYNTPDL